MASQLKQFSKAIEKNPAIEYAISTILAEYDIRAAHATALYFIKGPDLYNSLMGMDKTSRNIQIGKMIGQEQGLHDKIAKLILKWFNEFCSVNEIRESNFVSSTRDSILLVNKKPLITTFENGLVKFRNKDGEFTSYIRINNMEVLFDNMSNTIRIKGVSREYVEGNPVFMKLFKQLISALEQSRNLRMPELLKKLNYLRNKYINSREEMMYASVTDGNKYVYVINGEKVISDEYLPEGSGDLVKTDNYMKLFLPVMKICFKPH